MDRLDKSLDELIQSKPRNKKFSREGGKGGGGGGKKNTAFKSNKKASIPFKNRPPRQDAPQLVQPTGAHHVVAHKSGPPAQARRPATAPSSTGGSILSRLGGSSAGAASSGTSVTFENLAYNVTKEDMTELCATVGEVTNTRIVYDRSGRSTGVATVVFARRSNAIAAIKKFNGVTLDGAIMNVKLSPVGGVENPFNPSAGEAARGFTTQKKKANVREGLFGTNTGDDDDEDNDRGGATFVVNLGGGASSRPVSSGQARGGPRRERPQGAGGGRGAFKGRGAGGGRGGGRVNKAPVSAADLDAEMDSYHNSK